MTMDELKARVKHARDCGESGLFLTVNVKKAPAESFVYIEGFGKGLVSKVRQNKNKTFDVSAVFKLSVIERNIKKWNEDNE